MRRVSTLACRHGGHVNRPILQSGKLVGVYALGDSDRDFTILAHHGSIFRLSPSLIFKISPIDYLVIIYDAPELLLTPWVYIRP